MFPHVRDVKGRKDLIDRGRSGRGSEQQEELRYQVTYHAYLASGGGGATVIHTKH